MQFNFQTQRDFSNNEKRKKEKIDTNDESQKNTHAG